MASCSRCSSISRASQIVRPPCSAFCAMNSRDFDMRIQAIVKVGQPAAAGRIYDGSVQFQIRSLVITQSLFGIDGIPSSSRSFFKCPICALLILAMVRSAASISSAQRISKVSSISSADTELTYVPLRG